MGDEDEDDDEDEDEDAEEDAKIKHRQRATMKDHSYAKDIKIKNLLLDWETDEETGCKVEPSYKENGPWRFLPTEPETTECLSGVSSGSPTSTDWSNDF